MSKKAEYYQLKGMVSELYPEDQAQVEQARLEVVAILQRSTLAMIGFCLAASEIEAMK